MSILTEKANQAMAEGKGEVKLTLRQALAEGQLVDRYYSHLETAQARVKVLEQLVKELQRERDSLYLRIHDLTKDQ